MRLPPQMCQVVQVSRKVTTGEDGYGNPTTTIQTSTITGCLLVPLMGAPTTETQGADFDRVVTSWKLYTPPGTSLQTTDRVQQGADRLAAVSSSNPAVVDLEVFGNQVVWPGMDGSDHHTEAMLKVYGG